ncbi:putative dipeptidyl-aminopeptidase B [Tuber borchii]|uniref:dipeptidyl-peptidase IV n=1 Tax=Tuber borchii TaxID=42251 RepID=A0A2T6ZLT3_TUBBO|nr:putative dipeptidyl-aminopeptidase B [Tuber borchii]
MYDPVPYRDTDEPGPQTKNDASDSNRSSMDSTSTTSLILERLNHEGPDDSPDRYESSGRVQREKLDEDDDLEIGLAAPLKPMERKVRRAMYLLAFLMVGGWLLALVVYVSREHFGSPDVAHDPSATSTQKAGKKITLNQVMQGAWRSRTHRIQWIDGPRGDQDGLLLTQSSFGIGNFLEVQDVRNDSNTIVLMKDGTLQGNGQPISAVKSWPSPDMKKVLVASDYEKRWRHSYNARYWIYDVEKATTEPLVPSEPEAKLSLAAWSPKGDAIAFVKDNNVFIRQLGLDLTSEYYSVTQVTKDGGANLFYGIPDWVYEEEVFSGNSALWWSQDGEFLTFLRTNETEVPEYPIQYFVSRPSGHNPPDGLENYPELEFIKYPKAGAPNPVVHLRFYDLKKKEDFAVTVENDFPDDDRLITEVVWSDGKHLLVRETNRESDVLRMVLIDVGTRSGKVVREVDISAIDGGWFEVSKNTRYIPADPANGRPHEGYIDTVIHEGYDHLGYFTPLDNKDPILLTSGQWEVVDAPSAVDLKNGIIYFVATKKSPIERHIYSVKLDGSDFRPMTDTNKDGRYEVSFSKLSGYALLTYEGPGIPWQKVVGTPSGDQSFVKDIEKNKALATLAAKHELPTFHYSTVNIDGFDLQVVERRPPHFNKKRKYPVLFQVYGGPGSQQVSKSFSIDFQAYIAAGLEYIVVTVDGRGTGFIGRKARVAVRGNLGYWEAHDQIETAKIWGKKSYVDQKRIAIWGWSYGGFMTLKTLELDAGRTFSYGMAVAPVTDWRFYDSIYTERYMHTPQHNQQGYSNATIADAQALSKSVRFLLMHGVADDNVHMQNSLALLDKLDLASVENYDVHVFPDSDHSIYFHNANRMVYDRLEQWLIRAFNGEFLKLDGLKPIREISEPLRKRSRDFV